MSIPLQVSTSVHWKSFLSETILGPPPKYVYLAGHGPWGCKKLDTTEVTEYTYVYMYIIYLEKAMAPHSSTLAWKIPWTEEPGGLQSMGSLRVRHD